MKDIKTKSVLKGRLLSLASKAGQRFIGIKALHTVVGYKMSYKQPKGLSHGADAGTFDLGSMWDMRKMPAISKAPWPEREGKWWE